MRVLISVYSCIHVQMQWAHYFPQYSPWLWFLRHTLLHLDPPEGKVDTIACLSVCMWLLCSSYIEPSLEQRCVSKRGYHILLYQFFAINPNAENWNPGPTAIICLLYQAQCRVLILSTMRFRDRWLSREEGSDTLAPFNPQLYLCPSVEGYSGAQPSVRVQPRPHPINPICSYLPFQLQIAGVFYWILGTNTLSSWSNVAVPLLFVLLSPSYSSLFHFLWQLHYHIASFAVTREV